jgi:serine/threonine protein kinase
MFSLIDDKSKNDDFLGQGSYGCVYYPGVDCKGKKNTKKTVTKVQEINFYSQNEKKIGLYIKKNIKNFKNYFSPIIKVCVVKFDIIEKSDLNLKKCDTLFEDYNSRVTNVLNYTYDTDDDTDGNTDDDTYGDTDGNTLKKHVYNEYFLMYSYYIKNKSLKDYYSTITNYSDFVISILNNFSYLLSSLTLLNKVKVIHNDLHVNNILINLKTNKPVILDFGMSFKPSFCYKSNKHAIDFYTLKKFIFDFRLDHYHINIEKRFMCFCVYNSNDDFYSNIESDDAVNLLTKTTIDFFIKDSYDSIANNIEISIFFTNDELSEYKNALQQFYYKFYNKTDYPTYSSIVTYLLDFVYAFNDLYSLTIDLLYVYDNNRVLLENTNTTENKNYKILLDFFIQLYKKVLYPDPTMRLKINEVYNIYMFIVNYIKTITINTNDETKYSAHFIIAFTKYLKSKSISIEVVFNKKFAFMNFNLLCTKTMFAFVKANI